jgi:hypothetical protein
MAKDTDQKAGALEAEKTGGTLSGLLAEEKAFDRRALWRIGWWGTAAVGTVTLAVIASQSAQEWRHDRISAADLARQMQLVQSLAHQTQSESRQLASAIETLNTDRDRLQARVTVLEEGLESVTGALAKQSSPQTSTSSPPPRASLPAATQTAAADPQAPSGPSPAPASGPQAASSSAGAAPSATGSIGATAGQSNSTAPGTTSAAPAVASVTTTSAAEKARPDPARPTGTAQTATSQGGTPAAPASGATATPATSHVSPARSALAALVTPKSIMTPAAPAAGKLVEPEKPARTEAAPATDAASSKPADVSDEAALTPAQKTEFAVDLGSANSINGLRALWRGLVKSNNDLVTLRPIIILKEGNTGFGMQLRLGAGPLGDAAAAARICAGLAESQRPCETTVYDGQRLAIRGDEAGALEAGKPAPIVAPKPARRRPYQSQRHTVREEPPAPAPAPPPAEAKPAEPSTLSTLFRRS